MPVVVGEVDDLLPLKDIHEVERSCDIVQLVWILDELAAEENGGDQLSLVEFSRHSAKKQTTLRRSHLGFERTLTTPLVCNQRVPENTID